MLNQFIDDFYDVLLKPSQGISRVAKEREIWHGLFVYLAVSLIATIATFGAVNIDQTINQLKLIMTPEAAAAFVQVWPILNLMLIVVFAPLLLFAWSAILQFSSELLGGTGKGLQVVTGVGYSQLPFILVIPFGLVARYLGFNMIGLVSITALIWSMILKVETLHVVQGFSRSRAALAYFLPALTLITAIFIFLILVGSFLMPLLSELYPI